MSIQKPNCENCPNTSCYNNLIRQDKILTLEQTLETRVSYVAVRDHTNTHGCLLHPKSKEYLMRDVKYICRHYMMEYSGACAYEHNPEHGVSYKCPYEGDYCRCYIISNHLMENVIKELERLKQLSDDEGFVVAAFHYNKAISLLKGGKV